MLVVFLGNENGKNDDRKMLMKLTTGADAINISELLNPKKLGNFKN